VADPLDVDHQGLQLQEPRLSTKSWQRDEMAG